MVHHALWKADAGTAGHSVLVRHLPCNIAQIAQLHK